MSSRDALAGEGWLKHAAALRALAAALTGDGSEAEDLVHETWLRATRQAESADRPRAWWSTILRNLVRDRVREQTRRASREREVARDERVPSEVEMLERLEIAQRVAAEVARLDEPYRTAIHLRYFEGLSVEEISQRLHSPLETTRARLRRGLEQLRERMDRACGGDRSLWSVALGAIALKAEPAGLATTGMSLASVGVIAMSAKLFLGLGALVVLGVGVYFMRPRAETTSALAHGAPVESAAPAVVIAEQSQRTTPVDRSPSEREPIAVPAAVTTVDPDRGTIVVLDEGGVEHPSESGSFSIVITKPRQETLKIMVKEGVWSQHLPEGATYIVGGIVLGERPAIALPNSGPFVEGPDSRTLRCEWASVARLHVVDANSGAELDGIRLYTVQQFDAIGIDVNLRRPDRGLVGEDLFSPIDVRYDSDAHSDPPTHLVGRSGYVWGKIQIDPRAGGDFVLKLQPGGSLHATFEGASRASRLRIRLYQSSTPDLKSIAEWGGDQLQRGPPLALDLDCLPAGEYVLRAEVGKSEDPKILAQQAFAVAVGAQANIALLVPALPKPEKYEVEFTLKMDPSWSHEKFDLLVDSQEFSKGSTTPFEWIMASKWTRLEAGVWKAKPVLLEAGHYTCTIDELYFGADLQVGGDPHQQVLLEIPAQVQVIVHAVDVESGEPVEGAIYLCAWKAPQGEQFFGGHNGLSETSMGQVKLFAPLGQVRLEAFTPEYFMWKEQILDLGPGRNEITLKLQRNLRLEIVLREGEKVVPWGMSAMNGVKCEAVNRRDLGGGIRGGSGRLTCFVREPGLYRITIPKLPGYQPIEPFEVSLEERKLIERIIPVVRE